MSSIQNLSGKVDTTFQWGARGRHPYHIFCPFLLMSRGQKAEGRLNSTPVAGDAGLISIAAGAMD